MAIDTQPPLRIPISLCNFFRLFLSTLKILIKWSSLSPLNTFWNCNRQACTLTHICFHILYTFIFNCIILHVYTWISNQFLKLDIFKTEFISPQQANYLYHNIARTLKESPVIMFLKQTSGHDPDSSPFCAIQLAHFKKKIQLAEFSVIHTINVLFPSKLTLVILSLTIA